MFQQHDYVISIFLASYSISPNGGDIFTVNSGDSINISCTLSGVLSPTSYSILWKHNNRTSAFNYTNIFMESDTTSPSSNVQSTVNHVLSTLHIVDAKYPMDDGTYQCIGSNSLKNSFSFITVMIQGTID